MRKLFSVFVTLVLLTFCTFLFSSVQVGEPVVEKFQAPLNYKAGSGLVYERVFHYPNAGYISIHFSKSQILIYSFYWACLCQFSISSYVTFVMQICNRCFISEMIIIMENVFIIDYQYFKIYRT